MNYSRQRRQGLRARSICRGIWAAALTRSARPRRRRSRFRHNLRHWIDDLGIDGVFVSGKQGEFFSMSLAERKRTFEIAVEEIGGARTSCPARTRTSTP